MKTKIVVLLMCLPHSGLVLAQDNKVESAKSKKWLESKDIKEMPKMPESQDSTKVTFKNFCKEANGKEIEYGQPGYDTCVARQQAQVEHKRIRDDGKARDEREGNKKETDQEAVGFKFGKD